MEIKLTKKSTTVFGSAIVAGILSGSFIVAGIGGAAAMYLTREKTKK